MNAMEKLWAKDSVKLEGDILGNQMDGINVTELMQQLGTRFCLASSTLLQIILYRTFYRQKK